MLVIIKCVMNRISVIVLRKNYLVSVESGFARDVRRNPIMNHRFFLEIVLSIVQRSIQIQLLIMISLRRTLLSLLTGKLPVAMKEQQILMIQARNGNKIFTKTNPINVWRPSIKGHQIILMVHCDLKHHLIKVVNPKFIKNEEVYCQ
jgi:hypothetical protein